MKFFLLAAFIIIAFNNKVEANCNITISSDTTQGSLDCADDQTMTVNEGVTWAGTVKKMIDVEDDDGFAVNTWISNSGLGRGLIGFGWNVGSHLCVLVCTSIRLATNFQSLFQ